jgi:hypothetical protein
VLVHPLPGAAAEPGSAGTQPYPAFTGEDEYDPGLYIERAGETVSPEDPAGAASAETDRPAGMEVDTQPYPNLREDAPRLPTGEQDPDPAHGAWVAEPEEIAGQADADQALRRSYPQENTAPPSGRMRSTPLPPED